MARFFKNNENVTLQIDTEELSPAHVRQIKALNSILLHVLTTDKENEFFDGSAELMRLCAALVKQAKFSEFLTGHDNISYADQALEYSLDLLQDHMGKARYMVYDN